MHELWEHERVFLSAKRTRRRNAPSAGDVGFFSQFTFLKWQSPNLFLDISELDSSSLEKIEIISTPIRHRRHADPSDEILFLGNVSSDVVEIEMPEKRLESEDQAFIEGRKVRRVHLSIERSSILRSIFFKRHQPPYICDMCEVNVTSMYPWVENLLEVHHLLPLSSPLHISTGATSLQDLVGICPNCHRATHRFYRRRLDDQEVDDFRTQQEARQAYLDAKEALVIQ